MLMSSGTERPHLASVWKTQQAMLPLLLAVFTLAHSHSVELILVVLKRGGTRSHCGTCQNKIKQMPCFSPDVAPVFIIKT